MLSFTSLNSSIEKGDQGAGRGHAGRDWSQSNSVTFASLASDLEEGAGEMACWIQDFHGFRALCDHDDMVVVDMMNYSLWSLE